MTRIPSGTTDQGFYFVALDSLDYSTPRTGLTGFSVFRSRNGAAEVAVTTPTTSEIDATNMPGVYWFVCDEDMDIDSGDDEQEMCFRLTVAGMVPVVKVIELFRPKITAGSTSTAQTGDSYARLGAPAGASVSADILTIDNLVDDLESRLGTPSNLGSGATVAANLVDIEGQTDDIGAAGAGLTAVPWNAAWDAEVQSEVVDALNVDTYAEPGQGTPAATATLAAKINYLYKSWRNRNTQTASQWSLYADDATTVDQKAAFSDNGTTADRGEIATGP